MYLFQSKRLKVLSSTCKRQLFIPDDTEKRMNISFIILKVQEDNTSGLQKW